MWIRETQGRKARVERKSKRYPTDLPDEEWKQIAPLLPKPAERRPARGSQRNPL
ncbi:transposase, partial [Brucella intermedia]|uniref:transposase n=1 Tax=Brucella intermedia TaxID=94625 RepID=UPI003B636EC5